MIQLHSTPLQLTISKIPFYISTQYTLDIRKRANTVIQEHENDKKDTDEDLTHST